MALVVKGFSLIESIVSMIILSLTIAIITTTINLMLLSSNKVNKSELTYVSLQKLDSLSSISNTLDYGKTFDSISGISIITDISQFGPDKLLIKIEVKTKSTTDSVTFSKIITTINEE